MSPHFRYGGVFFDYVGLSFNTGDKPIIVPQNGSRSIVDGVSVVKNTTNINTFSATVNSGPDGLWVYYLQVPNGNIGGTSSVSLPSSTPLNLSDSSSSFITPVYTSSDKVVVSNGQVGAEIVFPDGQTIQSPGFASCQSFYNSNLNGNQNGSTFNGGDQYSICIFNIPSNQTLSIGEKIIINTYTERVSSNASNQQITTLSFQTQTISVLAFTPPTSWSISLAQYLPGFIYGYGIPNSTSSIQFNEPRYTITQTLPTPTLPGKTFVGWYQDVMLTIPAVVPFTTNLPACLYAKWR